MAPLPVAENPNPEVAKAVSVYGAGNAVEPESLVNVKLWVVASVKGTLPKLRNVGEAADGGVSPVPFEACDVAVATLPLSKELTVVTLL